MLAIAMILALVPDESAARSEAEKALKSKDAAARIAGLEKLKGAKEGKSVQVLAGALEDPEKDVRRTAAELLEGASDPAGLAIDSLAGRLRKTDEDPAVRLACAKALMKSPFQAVPIRAMIDCMGSIRREDKHLHKFGGEVTALLDRRTGKTYGADQGTVDRWNDWYTDNVERLKAEDARLKAATGAGSGK